VDGALTIPGTRALAEAAADWEALADATGAGPFVRPGWVDAWSQAFGDGREIHVLTAHRDGKPAGMLPVVTRRGALTSPTNWHTPAFGPVAADAGIAGELAAAAVERAGGRLDLSFLDPGDPFAHAVLDAARRRGRLVIARPVLRSPYVRLTGDFESYAATRPAKLRREIGRRRRRLAEHGAVEVTFTDGREDLQRLLDEGLAVEGSGWKTQQGTAISQDPATERFYRDVAAWAAARGWLDLGFVRVGGRAVAFSYAIVLHRTVHVVKVGFDPAFARYAVGTLLTSEAIERAFGRGMEVYDFLGAEDRYKLDWTDEVRERIRVQAFSRSPRGAAGFLAWRHGRPVARAVAAGVRSRARGNAR
jgi:CelD/BcsL family acetyltransferase involved in cellulose biosynthesis